MNEWMDGGMNECIMNCEKTRFDTFQSWPTNAEVDPQRIAKAGFYYTGVGLEVECFSCGGRISEWNYADQVMMRHRQMNPNCPFVKDPIGSGNVPVVNRSPSLYSQTSESSQSGSLSGSGQNNGNFLTALQNNNASSNNTSNDPSSIVSASDNSPSSQLETVSPPLEQPTRRDNNRDLMYKREAVRLRSFQSWPLSHIVSPQQLARAGFFYLQERDHVQCAFCGGIVQDWQAGDDPEREHQRHFPNCPLHFNMFVGNVPISEGNDGEHSENISRPSYENVVVREVRPLPAAEGDEYGSQVVPINELGIHSHRGPKYPKYSTIESRLRTFNNWPAGLCQTPQQLAQAGFFYTGANDQVRCFHCDGGLRRWDEHDDPWIEHARWFSKCTYVILVKGEEFIQQALNDHPPVLTGDILQRNTSNPPLAEETHYRVREVTDEEMDGLMNMVSVRTALEMGLDASNIRLVLRQNMEQTGLPYSSFEALIEAVLDISSDTNTPESPTAENNHPPELHSGEPSHAQSRDDSSSEGAQAQQLTLSTSKSLPNFSVESGATEASIERNDNSARSMPQLSQEKVTAKKKFEDDKEYSLEEENRRLKEARLCKICMDEEVGVVFVPCGHLVTCVNCTPSIEDCPMCRQPIKATVRTFLS